MGGILIPGYCGHMEEEFYKAVKMNCVSKGAFMCVMADPQADTLTIKLSDGSNYVTKKIEFDSIVYSKVALSVLAETDFADMVYKLRH